MNIEHRTPNVERRSADSPVYDLEERLLDFAVRIIGLVEALPGTRAGNHVAGQLLRSGTSALPNHGEAQAAESRADFVHKLKICLKELRETKAANQIEPLLRETDELIRIFVKSIQTSQQRGVTRSKFNVER